MKALKRMRRAWNISRALGRGVFSSTLSSVGSIFGVSGYTAVDPTRGALGGKRPGSATANQILTASLTGLRNFSRHLERNNPTARAAVEGLVANIVGTGIALEPDTGDDKANERIRAVWLDFIEDCCINGSHDIYWLQGQALRETIVAGEFLWRFIVDSSLVDEGKIPLSILPLEAEWLHQQSNSFGIKDSKGITWINGIGVNIYGKPVAYRLSNPELFGSDYEEVPASQIVHDFERRRALQARGEPWFAPVLEVLQQERDLVDYELAAAKNGASIGVAVTSDYHDPLDTETNGSTDDPAQSLRLGGIARLNPGEHVEILKNERPSQQIAPFRDNLRGDTAGAMRLPQRFLDRDPSKANKSALHVDLIDTDRLLGPLREWFGHATIGRVYKAALPYLALKVGIKAPNAKYRLIPDGQPFVDPVKDIEASILAIRSGLSTWSREIGKRGGDSKKMLEELKKEIGDELLNTIFVADQAIQKAPQDQPSKGITDE